jgi:hypothetical protein
MEMRARFFVAFATAVPSVYWEGGC